VIKLYRFVGGILFVVNMNGIVAQHFASTCCYLAVDSMNLWGVFFLFFLFCFLDDIEGL
jgi:hypothetical protein